MEITPFGYQLSEGQERLDENAAEQAVIGLMRALAESSDSIARFAAGLKVDRDVCFYCDALLTKGNREMDHFPIPDSAGGKAMVPACVTCHDMKDRFPLAKWPIGFVAAAMADQCVEDFMVSASTRDEGDILAALQNWSSMSRNGRLFVAKMMRVAHEPRPA